MMPTTDETTTLANSGRRRGLLGRSVFSFSAVVVLSTILAASTVMIDAFETTLSMPRTTTTSTVRHNAPATASPVYSNHHTSGVSGGGALILDHADTDVSTSKMMTITTRQKPRQQMIQIDTSSCTTLQSSSSMQHQGRHRQLMQMGSSSSTALNKVLQNSQPTIKMSGPKLEIKKYTSKNQPTTSRRTTRHMVSSSSSSSSSRNTSSSSTKGGDVAVVAAGRTTTTTPSAISIRDFNSVSGGLTREEEVQFSFQIRTLRAAVRLRDQMMMQQASTNNDDDDNEQHHKTNAEPLTEREWAQACGTTVSDLRRLLYEGQEARTAMCNANVGLVTSIAKRHYHALKDATRGGHGGSSIGTILTLQDFIQEGNLGLMEAAERYEPEKGFRFSTYATYWIRQRILRSISDSSRTIRLPAHVHGILQKIYKLKRHSRAMLGREPTLLELSQQLEMSPTKIQMYTESSRNVISLELPLNSNSGSGSFKSKSDRIFTLGDTLASDAPTPEEDAQAEYLQRDVAHVIQTELTERERAVLQCRFGLCPKRHQARSVAETAHELGLTSDRVRLIEARALNKLRHPQRNYRLKEYIVNDHSSSHAHHAASMEEKNNSNAWGGLTKTAATTTTTTTLVEGYDLATSSSSLSSGFSSSGTATLDEHQHQDTHHHRNDRRWFF